MHKSSLSNVNHQHDGEFGKNRKTVCIEYLNEESAQENEVKDKKHFPTYYKKDDPGPEKESMRKKVEREIQDESYVKLYETKVTSWLPADRKIKCPYCSKLSKLTSWLACFYGEVSLNVTAGH